MENFKDILFPIFHTLVFDRVDTLPIDIIFGASIKRIDISNIEHLNNIDFIKNTPLLESFDISYIKHRIDLEALRNNNTIKSFKIIDNMDLSNYSPILEMNVLENLTFHNIVYYKEEIRDFFKTNYPKYFRKEKIEKFLNI